VHVTENAGVPEIAGTETQDNATGIASICSTHTGSNLSKVSEIS